MQKGTAFALKLTKEKLKLKIRLAKQIKQFTRSAGHVLKMDLMPETENKSKERELLVAMPWPVRFIGKRWKLKKLKAIHRKIQ